MMNLTNNNDDNNNFTIYHRNNLGSKSRGKSEYDINNIMNNKNNNGNAINNFNQNFNEIKFARNKR